MQARDSIGRAILILSLVAPLALAAPGDAPAAWDLFVAPLLDAEAGGVAYFPAEFAGGAPVEILDPSGFEVRMSADDPGDERVRPAGEPFEPPRGRWRVWLESEAAMRMTPFSDLVVFPARRGRGVSPHMLPVAPAGRVGVAAQGASEAGDELWLLAAGGSAQRYELSRRRPLDELGGGVLMPAGAVLAALSSGEDGGRLAALSRPFALAAGETRPAPLERPPDGRSWLLAYVERPADVEAPALADLTLTVVGEGEDHPAEAQVATPWGVYGAWYDLPPGELALAAGNRRLYLPPQPLALASGAIARVDGSLVERPSLDVGLVLPSWLRQGPLELSVVQLPGGEEIERVELSSTAGRHRFDGLVQGPVEVVLDTRAGPFRRRVDLTGVREGAVTLAPELR